MAIDFTTDVGKVRLLLNDTNEASLIFAATEIDAYLALEGGNVKLATAQALDTIADDEALTSKVIKTQDLSTDGAKTAEILRKRAAGLRAQAAVEAEETEDGFFFGIVEATGTTGPELTGWPNL